MQKEQLKKYLSNKLLVQTIRQKEQINDTRKKLHDMFLAAHEIGVSGTAVEDIKTKCDEYMLVCRGYSNMIEDVWKVSWQSEDIIRRHIDCTDAEIEKLPEHIKS